MVKSWTSTWIDTADDRRWLLATHLRHVAAVPEFGSAELFGNEDCPDRIDLYCEPSPDVEDEPVASYVLLPESRTYRREEER